jgi:RoxA-like, cytochrome c-like
MQARSIGIATAGLIALVASGTAMSQQAAKAADDTGVVSLDQAWSPEDRAAYYWTSQGSALLSYDIYLALEVTGSNELFNSASNSDRVGLLVADPDPKSNPDGLPIGLDKAVVPSGQFKGVYAGLTCAACHTGQIQYRGKQIRIDGGSANRFDLVTWMRSLDAALQATRADPVKFRRMLERIRLRGPVDEAELRQRLEKDSADVHTLITNQIIAPFPPGPGRLDAADSIWNLVSAIRTNIPENTFPNLAPVKPPFLWNAPQSAWVQWRGTRENPLPRNFGQALGVFARLNLTAPSPAEGLFESTVDVQGIVAIERLLRRLAPPKWPEDILGPLDQSKVKQGARLFAENCAGCHTTYPYRWSAPVKQGKRFIENALVPLTVIGTESQAFGPFFSTLPTTLTRQLAPLFGGREVVPGSEVAGFLFQTPIDQAIKEGGFTQDELVEMNGYQNFGTEPRAKPPAVPSYKAGPRDGVWATGPFLHNGSVPNLYELLLPAAQRSKTFYVGRDFDPVKVGVDTSGKSGTFLLDTSLLGNSNAGHSFENGSGGPGIIGRELTDAERYAIIEYIKSIPNEPGRVTPHGGPEKPLVATDDPTWFNYSHPY